MLPTDWREGDLVCSFCRNTPKGGEIESKSSIQGTPKTTFERLLGFRKGLWLLPLFLIVGIPLAVLVGQRSNHSEEAVVAASPLEVQKLPAPALPEMSLKEALQKRSSQRAFSSQPLDSQALSNLLWSANGVNRPEKGGRTAPTAYDWRYVDIYLLDAAGVGRYNAETHAIERLSNTDLREKAGAQDFVKLAALTIILVSDEAKMLKNESHGLKPIFSGVSIGAVVQNIYLLCAIEGLNVVVRASIDRDPLHDALGLRSEQKIIVAQTIGYPPEHASQ